MTIGLTTAVDYLRLNGLLFERGAGGRAGTYVPHLFLREVQKSVGIMKTGTRDYGDLASGDWVDENVTSISDDFCCQRAVASVQTATNCKRRSCRTHESADSSLSDT